MQPSPFFFNQIPSKLFSSNLSYLRHTQIKI